MKTNRAIASVVATLEQATGLRYKASVMGRWCTAFSGCQRHEYAVEDMSSAKLGEWYVVSIGLTTLAQGSLATCVEAIKDCERQLQKV
jgi:hypothetical protein